MDPARKAGYASQVFNYICRRSSKKIHAKSEKSCINDSGNDDPFPKLVSLYENVCFRIGLESYNNFFQQNINLKVNISRVWSLESKVVSRE
jgi:hypothetical protein